MYYKKLLVCAIITYLLLSYVEADFNILTWSVLSRIVFPVASLFMANKDDKDDLLTL